MYMQDCINLNILECKLLLNICGFSFLFCINLNILECKLKKCQNKKTNRFKY